MIPAPSQQHSPPVTTRRRFRHQPVRSLTALAKRLSTLEMRVTDIPTTRLALLRRRLGWLQRDVDTMPDGLYATDFDALDLAVQRLEVGR